MLNLVMCALCLIPGRQDPELEKLAIGEPIEAVLEQAAEPAWTDWLKEARALPMIGWRDYDLELSAGQAVKIEVSSAFFQPHLVLVSATEEILGEAEASGTSAHISLKSPSRAVSARLRVGSLFGVGSFRLTVDAIDSVTLPPLVDASSRMQSARRDLETVQSTLGEEPSASLALGWSRLADALRDGEDPGALAARRRALELVETVAGPRSLWAAESLVHLSRLERARGRVDVALSLWERSLEIRRERSGSQHLTVADSAEALGATFYQLGKYSRARELQAEVVEIRRAVLGRDHVSSAKSLLNLATISAVLNERDQATQMLEEVQPIYEREYGVQHREVAILHNTLGMLLYQSARPDEACLRFSRAVEIYEAIGEPTSAHLAVTLSNLGQALAKTGAFEEGKRRLTECVAMFESLGPLHRTRVVSTLSSLAWVVMRLDDFVAAEKHLRRAIDLGEQCVGPDNLLLAAPLVNLGDVLGMRPGAGVVEARECYERAVRLMRRHLGPGHPETARAQNALGTTLLRIGNPELARVHLREAVEILEKFQSDAESLARTWSALAEASLDLKEHETALREIDRAVEIAQSRLGERHRVSLGLLANRGVTLVKLGDWERAARDLTFVISANEEQGMRDISLATSLDQLAACRLGQDRPEDAQALYERSLAMIADLDLDRSAWGGNIRFRYAGLLFLLGKTREALSQMESLLLNRRENLRRMLPVLSDVERHQSIQSYRQELPVMMAITRELGESANALAYEAALRWKGQVFRSAWPISSSTDPERQPILEELLGVQRGLSRLFHPASAPVANAGELARLLGRQSELERRLSAGRTPERPSVDLVAIREVLPDDTAIVDFLIVRQVRGPQSEGERGRLVWSPEHVLAFVVTKRLEKPVRIDLGPRDALEAAVRELQVALGKKPGRDVTPLGREVRPEVAALSETSRALRRQLFDPLAPSLLEAKQVLICPDGFLGALPWSVLETEDGEYLIEERSFVVLEDVASLVPLLERGRRSTVGDLLAIGGLDYGARSETPRELASSPIALVRAAFDEPWSTLPETDEEVSSIAHRHEAVAPAARRHVLTGKAADEGRLKSLMKETAFLHMATHAYFEPGGLASLRQVARQSAAAHGRESGSSLSERLPQGVPEGLLSGLVCSGANGVPADEDGLLTATEVASLDLSRADLVVLSACKSALGRQRLGEGMMGLRRAFRRAGARTVISATWSVPDRATRELMEAFYRNLWERGESVGDALRNAQLERLEVHRQRGDPDPASWGAFVVSGDWR